MMSKALAFALVVGGCVIAAAGGAYVAVRHNTAQQATVAPETVAQPAAAAKPVSETEAVVQTPPAPVEATGAPNPNHQPIEATRPEPIATPRGDRPRPREGAARPKPVTVPDVVPAPPSTPPAPPVATETPAVSTPRTDVTPEPTRTPEPPAPPAPQFEELVVPASSVIGLQLTTGLSSERAQIEDRVEARVTRDVLAAGRVAIPAGSRVIGSVTTVERGGKVKERARLGVRFHTLVLADGREIALRTDGIFREGDPPSTESARKIGGAAVGGAILGAIIGGGKGAAIGGVTGAAGGTAAVMAGDRNPATLAAGSIVTVRLTAPVTIEVRQEK